MIDWEEASRRPLDFSLDGIKSCEPRKKWVSVQITTLALEKSTDTILRLLSKNQLTPFCACSPKVN